MVNINFLIISYFIGISVDWIFQTQWQASNKSKWCKSDNKFRSLAAVVSHSLVYSILTTALTLLLLNNFHYCFIIFITLFISHALIDTRIPVKIIMKLKGMSEEQINDYQNYGFMHIGIDHRLHEIMLLLLSIIVKV